MQDSQRLQSLFAAAVELPEAERATFLLRECADDPALLQQLQQLLVADTRLSGMTARPVVAGLADALASAEPGQSLTGQRVGPFALREELGHGGMGRIYRAERVDGAVAQQVAIKFVRRELLDGSTIRRFHLERQFMATLDHPHIARLIDAAELADGTPYYVMEYVAGVPITVYCANTRMDLRGRVELLKKVCGAVAEAHRELIVHRDLKPANILIDTDGTPKLLDFGIAKPLLPVGSAVSAATETVNRYFSPQYAAPEQVSGAAVGVACDVYALGLMLYELLCGQQPFDFAGLSAGQIERLILQVPPQAPSAMLARKPDAVPQIRARQLRGDLDDIVLRCLRKSPGERYASVEHLEADLGNYLAGQPVLARGGHAWYSAQKFVRRNAVAVTAAVLVVTSLVAGIVGFAWQARLASQRAAELEAVARFQSEMLAQIEPGQAGELLNQDVRARFEQELAATKMTDAERAEQIKSFTANWARVNHTDVAVELIDKTILKPAIAAIEQQFADQPLVAASLRQTLADRYMALARDKEAQPLLQQSVDTRERLLGPLHVDTMTVADGLARAKQRNGDLSGAEALFRQTLARRTQVLGAEHRDTLSTLDDLAFLLVERGQHREAETIYVDLLKVRRRQAESNDMGLMSTLHNFALALEDQGRLAEAETLQREALDISTRARGPDDLNTMSAFNNLAVLLWRLNKLDEAETMARESLARRERVLGESHPFSMTALHTLGLIVQAKGRLDEAEGYMRNVLERRRRAFGDEHPHTLNAMTGVAFVLMMRERWPESEAAYRDAVASFSRVYGDEHAETIRARKNLAETLLPQNKLQESEALMAQVLEQRRALLGPTSPDTLATTYSLGAIYVAQGRNADAIALMAPAEADVRKTFSGARECGTAKLLRNLGAARGGIGEFALGEANLLEAHEMIERSCRQISSDAIRLANALVVFYGRWHAAEPGKGYDAKAAEWQQRLAQLTPPS